MRNSIIAFGPTCVYPGAKTSSLNPFRAIMRILAILFAMLVLVTPIRASAGDKAKKKPNILFIYTDDQSYRTVSCYPGAYKFAKTPNIDKLASMGLRFQAAYNGSW